MPQLDSLGLKENPFNNNTAQRYFYADQNRAQILESTEHLIEFSNNLQVVMGEPGVGKTHFMIALQARKDNNWRVAKVEDAAEHDTLSLIQAILNSFGAVANNETDLLEALENQLSEIIKLGFKPVLLIDNAQALSADSLRFLLQLSRQQQDDEPYIHIVLFTTTIITDILQAPEFKDFRDIIHITIINNFDKEGVSGYLRHKLTVAGFNRESPFTPRIIDSIYKNSAGIPEQINFYASKFLASSGKGENYIEAEPPVVSTTHVNNNETKFTQGDKGTSSFNTPDYSDLEDEKGRQSHNSLSAGDNENVNAFNTMGINNVQNDDQIDEQLSRLTEEFDEIEKMGEQIDEYAYSDEDVTDKKYREYDDPPGEDLTDQPFYETNASRPSKFIIPLALGGLVLLALFVINSVFNQAEELADEKNQQENIELLPLELPAEAEPLVSPQKEENQQQELTEQNIQADEKSQERNAAAIKDDLAATEPEPVSELEIIEAGSSEVKQVAAVQKIDSNSSTAVIPEITAIEPEPIIGSNKAQYVTIRGHNFTRDMSLTAFLGSQKMEFSELLTPKEWHYENEGKIKLYVITGIENNQLQMHAKNSNGKQSKIIHFDVVKPFIAQLEISSILPSPVIGSDTRQKLTIMGKGFSRQTEVKLEWDENKKHFSSRLTPEQFEYAGSDKINLFITTGKKERLWKVSIIKSGSEQLTPTSFKVISGAAAEQAGLKVKTKAKTVQEKKAASSKTAKTASAKGKAWIWTQNPSDYTIQLLALSKEQALKAFIESQNIKQKAVYFKINRNGKPLYVLIYGVYADKQSAEQAKNKLQSRIKGSKPWVRSFSSIHGLIGQ